MNPLNVLRGASLMTSVEGLRRSNGELLLDGAGHCRLTLDEHGHAAKVTIEGEIATLVAYGTGSEYDNPGHRVVMTATPDIRMRQAIEIRHRTGTPVLFVEDGKVVGVVGDDEIYRGMLRQTGLAQQSGASTATQDSRS